MRVSKHVRDPAAHLGPQEIWAIRRNLRRRARRRPRLDRTLHRLDDIEKRNGGGSPRQSITAPRAAFAPYQAGLAEFAEDLLEVATGNTLALAHHADLHGLVVGVVREVKDPADRVLDLERKAHAGVKNARWGGGPPAAKIGATVRLRRMLDPAPSDAHLQPLHRTALTALAVLAAILFTLPAGDNAVPPALAIVAALVLGVGVLAGRALSRSPVLSPANRVHAAEACLACAVFIGLLGVATAFSEGARDAGLGFVVGAAILALRPPRPLLRAP